jgi:SM-20-related protein
MRQNPDTVSTEPVVEVFDNLAPAHLHVAAWATCMGKNWYFGHGSVSGGGPRFWRMDLDGDAAFQAIWEHARARCEALAGGPLRVVSQYANGHTYGLGGNPHLDDSKPGSYTLLYYPNPEWQDGWDGETVFYDEADEIALSVRLRPNRAVFFDARIPHCGRAPSRSCTALRVSVAFKLERYAADVRCEAEATISRPASAPAVVAPAEREAAEDTVNAAAVEAVTAAAGDAVSATAQDSVSAAAEDAVVEIGREGAQRIYTSVTAEAAIAKAVGERLQVLSESVRLPGFRPGKVPRGVMEERYGAQARAEILKRMAATIVQHSLPAGSVASSCELTAGEESGAMEIRIHATHLPDLAEPDFSQAKLERLEAANPAPEEAAFLRSHLKKQALNHLDASYSFPLFRGIIDTEFEALWAAASAQGAMPADGEERAAMDARLRTIAERRLRLGLIVAELARRFGIRASSGAEVEDRTIDRLIAQAPVAGRRVSREELLEMMRG